MRYDPQKSRVSEDVRKLNPNLFGMGALAVQDTQRNQRSEIKNKKLGSVQTRVGFRITLIAFARRKIDSHDNLRSTLKPLVDRITEWLGFDNDADESLNWEYGQQITAGSRGVAVKIEMMYENDCEGTE